MFTGNQQFAEIRVYEQVAERTGNVLERNALRRSKNVCSTIRELARKSRSSGDGIYYLPVDAWPEGENEISLVREWTTMS